MRRINLLVLVTVFALVAGVASPVRAEIRRVPWWENPAWNDVLARAAADSGSAILIHFHAPWCGPCRLLDAFVYNENEVVDALADVVTVKIDIDVPTNGRMRDRFAVELLPTLVWCDARGREVNRFTGYRNAEEFLAEVTRFRREEHSSWSLAERLARTPEDPQLLLEMAALQARRGNDRASEVLYLRATNRRDDPVVLTRALLGLALAAHRADEGTAARDLGREAARTGAVWTEVVAFQEAVGDSAGLLETYRARSVCDDMDVVALDGFARMAVGLDVEMEEASRHALRAVVLSDRVPEIIATLAECYHRRGLHAKAVRWLGEAIDQDPPRLADYQATLVRYEEARAADPWGLKAERRTRRGR